MVTRVTHPYDHGGRLQGKEGPGVLAAVSNGLGSSLSFGKLPDRRCASGPSSVQWELPECLAMLVPSELSRESPYLRGRLVYFSTTMAGSVPGSGTCGQASVYALGNMCVYSLWPLSSGAGRGEAPLPPGGEAPMGSQLFSTGAGVTAARLGPAADTRRSILV